jgi:hypothetical protein
MTFTGISSASVTELNAPAWVVQGEMLSISGKAAPGEEVWIGSSFDRTLQVSADGRYSDEYKGIDFPEGKKKISVRAENIKNIKVSISPFTATCDGETIKVTLWPIPIPLIEKPLEIKDGVVVLSLSFPMSQFGTEIDIPSGKRDIEISGDALDNAAPVILSVAVSINVSADSNGYFSRDVSTSGVPIGEFEITAGEQRKTVRIVSTEPTPSPSPTPTPSNGEGDGAQEPTPSPTPSPTPTPTPSPSPTLTPTPTPTPTMTSTPSPSPTLTPQTTPIESPTPQNKTTPPSQETTRPLIPGFESAGCIAALIIIVMLKRKRVK